MSWTKRQIIEQAFEEIGMAAYVFDLQPEQVESARRKLDTMVAGWSSKDIQIGYPLPDEMDGGDIDQETNVPDYAIDAMVYGLAIKIAPSHGKAIGMDTKLQASNAYSDLLRKVLSNPPSMKYSCSLPSGAGNKSYGGSCNTFIRNKQDNNVLPPNQSAEFFNE